MNKEVHKNENGTRIASIGSRADRRNLPSFLYSRYDELTLFLMSISLIFILFVSAEARIALAQMPHEFLNATADEDVGGMILMIGLFILAGLFLSIYRVFSKKRASLHQFVSLVAFGMAFSIGSSYFAVLGSPDSSLFIIPLFVFLLSIIGSIFTIIQCAIDVQQVIPIEKSSITKVIWVSLALLAIVLCSHFVFGNFWSITLSMSILLSSWLGSSIDWVTQRFAHRGKRELDAQ